MRTLTYIFNFTTDGTSHDVTFSEASESLESHSNYVWNVSPSVVGLSGLPIYTIEVSNDGTTWFEYATEFTNVAIDDAVEDTQLSFKYMRVNHVAGTSTVGTVTYTLTQKQRV